MKRNWVVAGTFTLAFGAGVVSACGIEGSGQELGRGASAGLGGDGAAEGGNGTVTRAGGEAGPEGGQNTKNEAGTAGAPGGEGGAKATGFRVVATDPDEAALDAEPDGSITVKFSEPLNAATVTTESIELRDVFLDRTVPAVLSIEGDTLTLAPEARLGLVARYEVTIDTSVAAETGAALAEDYSFAFAVRDGIWKETQLATGEITFMSENLGLDAAGTTFISWVVRKDGAYCPTMARRVPLLAPPDEAVTLTPTTVQSDCDNLRTSAGALDLAATTWEEDAGPYVTQYRGGQWVGGPNLATGISLDNVNVKVAPNGAVHLLVYSASAFRARQTDTAGTWLEAVDSIATDRPRSPPEIAFTPEGDGWAAWRSRDADDFEMILVARYSQGQGKWLPAVKLPGSVAAQANTTHSRGAPNLAINASGQVAVVWVRGSDAGQELYANLFVNEAWQAPVPLSLQASEITVQDAPGLVAVGDDFVVAWNQRVTGVYNTYSARFSQGAWSPPQLLSDGIQQGLSRMPRLGADERHNLLLIWPRETAVEGVYDCVQARYLRATGAWSAPTSRMPTPITDAYLDEHALPLSVQGYFVAMPFGMAPNGVAAAGFATRPLHIVKQYATNPRLAVFQ